MYVLHFRINEHGSNEKDKEIKSNDVPSDASMLQYTSDFSPRSPISDNNPAKIHPSNFDEEP